LTKPRDVIVSHDHAGTTTADYTQALTGQDSLSITWPSHFT